MPASNPSAYLSGLRFGGGNVTGYGPNGQRQYRDYYDPVAQRERIGQAVSGYNQAATSAAAQARGAAMSAAGRGGNPFLAARIGGRAAGAAASPILQAGAAARERLVTAEQEAARQDYERRQHAIGQTIGNVLGVGGSVLGTVMPAFGAARGAAGAVGGALGASGPVGAALGTASPFALPPTAMGQPYAARDPRSFPAYSPPSALGAVDSMLATPQGPSPGPGFVWDAATQQWVRR